MFNLTIDEHEFKRLMKEAVREEVAAQIREMVGYMDVQNSTNNKPYIKGIKGLADFLGVGKSTAQKIKNKGIVPFSQQPWSKIVLFDKEKVKLALENNLELRKMCSRKRK